MSILHLAIANLFKGKYNEVLESLDTDLSEDTKPVVVELDQQSIAVLPQYERNPYPRFVYVEEFVKPSQDCPDPATFFARASIGINEIGPKEIPVAEKSKAFVPGCGAFGRVLYVQEDKFMPGNKYLIYHQDHIPNGGIIFRVSSRGMLHLWKRVNHDWLYSKTDNFFSRARYPVVLFEHVPLCLNSIYYTKMYYSASTTVV